MVYTFTPAFQYLIDWDKDGDWDEAEEDVSEYVISAEWSNGAEEAFQLVSDEARLILTLNNETRRFSPEYAASPLNTGAFALRPECKVKINQTSVVTDNDGNIVRDSNGNIVYASVVSVVYTGWIELFTVDPMKNGSRTVIIEATGPKRFLDAGTLRIPLLTNVTASEIIETILEDVVPDLISNYTLLDTGSHVYEFFGHNFDDDITPYEAITELVNAEQGRFYFDKRGRPVFLSSDRLQTTMDLSATITDDTNDIFMHELEYQFGNDIQNVIRVTYYPRTVDDDLSVVWELDEPVTIHAGDSTTFRAKYSAANGQEVGGLDAVEPNEGDGSLVVSAGAVTVSEFIPQAQSAKITLTNDSTRRNAVVDSMKIYAYKIRTWDAREVERSDFSSVADYGNHILELDLKMVNDQSGARAIGDYIREQRAAAIGAARSITIYNRSDDTLEAIRTLGIGDRIHIESYQPSHTKDYFIIGYHHTVLAGGLDYSVIYFLEPVPRSEAWILGFPGRTELGQTTIIGL